MMKKETVRIALAQLNCTVGDLKGNSHKIIQYIERTKGFGVDIIAFPELALTGYPPEDLLLKPKFIKDNGERLKEIARHVEDIVAIVGFVDRKERGIYNAAAIIYKGKICAVVHKMLLPNYGVFDEKRYFSDDGDSTVVRYGPCVFGVNICEDIWHEAGPVKAQKAAGAELIININASPYHAGKISQRKTVLVQQAKASRVAIAYVNMVGGQDELVFDGQSLIMDAAGTVLNKAEAFKEDLLITDIELPASRRLLKHKRLVTLTAHPAARFRAPLPKRETAPLDQTAEVYQALVLGLHDYALKNNFQKVVVGLSGGIDSSLVATLAVDALGKENVFGVFMPSRYTSRESEVDARQLAGNLGIQIISVPIEQIYKMYLLVLEPHFVGSAKNITEENLQARIRGNLLMAFSNKFGWLVLTTGNKSEMSTGYATLYGDMAGGFAVIKDVPKTLVYKLCVYRNGLSPVIPERVFAKAPTAELKLEQKDSDTLPPYEMLDPILKAYVEEDKSLAEIMAMGFDKAIAMKVIGMVDSSEYKRRQSPPGIKITPKAFGKDRRMPITNKYNSTV